MKCLVTGASGFIGSYLTQKLLEKGVEVTALVRPESDLWRISDFLNRVKLIKATLEEPELIRKEILKSSPDAVFHCAWHGVDRGRNEQDQIHINVTGSLELLKILSETTCGTWIGIGSQAEYGPHNQALREDLTPKPVTAYGKAKYAVSLLSEKICELNHMRFLWVRLLATYGPKDHEHYLIPYVINSLLNKISPSLTPGEQHWDYLFVEDVVDAITKLALESKASGFFNLASGKTYQIRDIAKRIQRLTTPDTALNFGAVPYREHESMLLSADINRLKNAINWTPKIDLDEGLRKTVEWHKTQKQRLTTLLK